MADARTYAGTGVRGRPRAGVALLLAAAFANTCLSARADDPPSIDADTAWLERMQQAVASLVERVSPAVVAIRADRSPTSLAGDSAAASPTPFHSGSGVIIREDGMILTSQHVIEGAFPLYVTLHDGRRFRATLVAADRRSDLAVLRVRATGLPTAKLGDIRSVRRGHLVLVLGNPLGLAGDGPAAVSQGVVSAIGRPLPETFTGNEDRYYGDMIQTSAQVGPGNSGGPLVDIHGRVIGIITALGTPLGATKGIGFAVPIGPHTRAVIDALVQGRQIEYGYLGVEVGTPTEAQIRAAGPAAGRGALLETVWPEGPAHNAGLRGGDLIVAVDGTDVRSADHFIRLIGAAGPGRKIKITFVRDSKRQHVTVQLVRRASPTDRHGPVHTTVFRGATLGVVDPALRDWSNLSGPALLVLRVDAGSPADRAGLTPGDIVVRIEGKPLTPDAGDRLGARSGDVLLGLATGGSVLIKE